MAKVITDLLHKEISNILSGLLDKVNGKTKAKLARIYSEFENADTPPGYED